MSDSKSVQPRSVPVLDRSFQPAVLARREFVDAAQSNPDARQVRIAVEQADGSIFCHSTVIFPSGHARAVENLRQTERLLKFLLWSRGGFRIYFDGPRELGQQLQDYYRTTATGRFDAQIMGERIYEKPFELVLTSDIPSERSNTKPLGRHLDGCRIGFDLGGSDQKVAAVIDGKCVFSEEMVWNPVPQPDPQWHFEQIMAALKLAARHLPRVDAIGGSSAGVIVNNRIKVASLFRGVPIDLFKRRVKDLFLEMKQAWGNIPFEVANDGEVTALAGSMSIGKNGVLGIALGTSMAGGYVNPEGNITSWLNELAFAPVDYNPAAPADEWSGDIGCGVQYFSQQCVGRLLEPAGIEVDPSLSLPEKLKHVQQQMQIGDERARKIYETIGTYLGYTLLHYRDFYEFEHVLLLGRVTTGSGGEIILSKATDVLRDEAPQFCERMQFHLPDEKEKRHGQAIAAASLPALR